MRKSLIFVVAVFLLAACAPSNEPNSKGLTSLKIENVKNAPQTLEVDTIRLMFVDDETQKPLAYPKALWNGSEAILSFSKATQPPLKSLKEAFENTDPSSYTASNPDVKIRFFDVLLGTFTRKGEVYISGVFRWEGADYFPIFFYASTDVKITGSVLLISSSVSTIDIDLVEGWNLVYFCDNKITSTAPTAPIWVYTKVK